MKVTYEELQYWASRFLLGVIIFVTVHFIVESEVIAFLISFAYGALVYKQNFKNAVPDQLIPEPRSNC